MIYLDTHVAVWAYAGRLDLFPPQVRALLNQEDLLISPMVALELEYLYELDKITASSSNILEALGAEVGLKVCDLPFDQVVASALSLSWTRDPFDRIIVAQAGIRRSRLLTKDETIRDRYPEAIWIEKQSG